MMQTALCALEPNSPRDSGNFSVNFRDRHPRSGAVWVRKFPRLGKYLVHVWLKKERQRHSVLWNSLLTMLGVSTDCIIPSERSVAECKRVGQALPVFHEYAQPEFHMTVPAMIGLLLLWSGEKRGGEASNFLLQSLVRACLTPAEIMEHLVQLLSDPQWNLCGHVAGSGLCNCMGAYSKQHGQTPNDVVGSTLCLVQLLTCMVVVGTACVSVTSILPRAHARLRGSISSGCNRKGHTGAVEAAGENDPSNAKRRRVDVNAVASLASSSSEQHISLGKLLVHHGLSHATLATRYHQDVVATNLAAGWQGLAGGLVYGVCLDAKRLGNPAEELLAAVCVNADSGKAIFAPFQVPLLAMSI
eukprot:2182576-Amphidinium_carterae.1